MKGKIPHQKMGVIRIALLLCFITTAHTLYAASDGFVKVQGQQFVLDDQPYYYIGTNYWYGSYLVMNDNDISNKKRLLDELNFMKANGVNNLRVLAASEGKGFVNGVDRTGPAFQTSSGEFSDAQLKGLDFLLQALHERNMKAVIFLSNNWEWSGGFLQYVNWHGGLDDSVMRRKLNWDEQRNYTSKFYDCDGCKKDYLEQVDRIMSHVNTHSGVAYVNEPAIMSWEIANEPRPMRPSANNSYATWLSDVAAFIKSKDKNHLVTIGNEGEMGTESMSLFESIHANKNIDYLTIHIWPKNWSWFPNTSIAKSFDEVLAKTDQYIDKHEVVARKLQKPMVVEEFGLPRDGHSFSIRSSTHYRDLYYQKIFDRLVTSVAKKDVIAGCNFWAMGGNAKPIPGQLFWKTGNDYMGDPPAEEQGLNSVFSSDKSTWTLIKHKAKQIEQLAAGKTFTPIDPMATAATKRLYQNMAALMQKAVMFGHQDDLAYGVNWKYKAGNSDIKEVTGDYPAVYGWELGKLELGHSRNLDSVPFDQMIGFIKDIYRRAGVVTISWHLDNPLTGKSAWDPAPGTVESILPGGDKHTLYKRWLDKIAFFMNQLRDDNNQPIPVIFRPFHELNGDWFWWGGKNCSPESFKNLWRFTISYLRDDKHLHHLLYAYNTDQFQTTEEYLSKYPGDEWTDIIGFDIYQREQGAAANNQFVQRTDEMLTMLEAMARERNKIPAITEFGFGQLPDANWWTQTFLKALGNHKLSYVLAWRNAGWKASGEKEFYVPYKGHPSAKDFVDLYKSKRILFQKDISQLKLYE